MDVSKDFSSKMLENLIALALSLNILKSTIILYSYRLFYHNSMEINMNNIHCGKYIKHL